MTGPAPHSWLEISKQALIHNISVHRRLIGRRVKLLAVVKSNAYGHGLILVSQVAEESGQVDWLGTASLHEARQLREAGIKLPILVLSYFRPWLVGQLAWAIKRRVSFMVYEAEQIKALQAAARRAKRAAKVHLKLETGMARLGLFPKQARDFLRLILKSRHFQLEGIASHFATAESADQKFLQQQLSVYNRFVQSVSAILPTDIVRHISCSAAITTAPQAHMSLVRLGVALYGLWPSRENRKLVKRKLPNFDLRPALKWLTRVIEVQVLPKGIPVGYDCTYVTNKKTIMAVLPIGYWDGLARGLSNNGYVIIKGIKCPIIGRVCMNITMVDASQAPNLKVGDIVTVIGRQGGGVVTVDEMADSVGTINYEIVTRINPLLPRITVE